MILVLPELWGIVMDNNDMFDTVWQVWQKERQSNELQQIPKTFYEDVLKHIHSINTASEIQKTTKENLLRTLNNIYERRKQKILVYVAYSQSIPQVPSQELNLYEKISKLVNAEKMNIDGPIESKPLLVIQDIPRIVLPSGKEIGPLEKDQSIALDEGEDKNFLISNNICKTA